MYNMFWPYHLRRTYAQYVKPINKILLSIPILYSVDCKSLFKIFLFLDQNYGKIKISLHKFFIFY